MIELFFERVLNSKRGSSATLRCAGNEQTALFQSFVEINLARLAHGAVILYPAAVPVRLVAVVGINLYIENVCNRTTFVLL